MKITLQNTVSGILLAAIFVVAGNAWLAFRAEDILAHSETWVVHTWQAINIVERTLNCVQEMETSERGYLLTHDPAYLGPYHEAHLQLVHESSQFKAITADNPRQQIRVQRLQTIIADRTTRLALTITLQEQGRGAEALALIRSGNGSAEMAQLRGLAANMESDEYALLAVRQHDSAQARAEARLTVALASFFDILFIILAVWVLGHERRLRERASAVAAELEKLQSISDVGMTRLSFRELTAELLRRLQTIAQADAVALYTFVSSSTGQTGGSGAAQVVQVEVVAALGVALAPGTVFQLKPGGPLDRASNRERVVRLNGQEVQELPVGEFTHAMGTLLILPLFSEDVLVGLIVVGQKGENAFSDRDEKLLQIIAGRMAIAIDRVRILELEQQARRDAEASALKIQELNAVLEERVRQRTAELETTNRELEAFSYSVSHDLRAPLRSVDGFSVALEEDYGSLLTGDGKHYLARIRVGVQRMGSLIDALLQLSRITRAELTPEPIELSTIAASVAEDVTQAHPDRRIQFSIEPGLVAQGDPQLLRVVFENMFGNAAKFTSKVEEARIAFGWSPGEKAYYVRDNGAGFDQQYAGKLFVAFQRLHGDKDFQGSGIGLATVARVVHRHHGTLWAQGAVGSGATFWFTLG